MNKDRDHYTSPLFCRACCLFYLWLLAACCGAAYVVSLTVGG